jgi:hypothetical protein
VKNLGCGYHRFDDVPVKPGQAAFKGLGLKAFLWTFKRFKEPVRDAA